MTVSSTTNRKSFAGNGVTTSFGTSPMTFFDTSDLVVYVVDDVTGVETLLVENTDYTASGGDGSTGTLDLSAGSSPYGAPATDTTLVIVRVLPLTQTVDLVNNDINDAEVMEGVLDKLTMLIQQSGARSDRSVRLDDSDPSDGDTMLLPGAVDRASKALGFDANGDLTVLTAGSAVTDAGSVTFIQDEAAAVSRTVEARLRDSLNVTDFMTVAEVAAYVNNDYTGSVTNVTTAVQAAITAAGGTSTNPGSLYFPAGVARLTASLLGVSHCYLFGPGVIDTNTKHAVGNQEAIKLLGITDFTVDGLGFHSAQLVPGETAISLYDTGAAGPCSKIRVLNCRCENIKLIRSEQSEHDDVSGYPYTYYDTVGNLHTDIRIIGNQCYNLIGGQESVEGTSIQLFWVRNVLIADNTTTGTDGLCNIWGGNHQHASWLIANRQCKDIAVINNQVVDSTRLGIVFVCVADGLIANNKVYAAGSEVVDVEGSENVMVAGNHVVAGQNCYEVFATSNNIRVVNNYGRVFTAANANLPFAMTTAEADPDLTHGGEIEVRGNTFIGAGNTGANGEYCMLGITNRIIFEDNKLQNCGIYVADSNYATIRRNVLEYSITTTDRLPIEIATMKASLWTTKHAAPICEIIDNIVNYTGATFAVVSVSIGAYAAAGKCVIKGNEFHNTGTYCILIQASGSVARAFSITNNRLSFAGGFAPIHGVATIASDTIFWKDNLNEFGTGDVLGAITGSGVTDFTTDFLSFTSAGSEIRSATPGVNLPIAWVLDASVPVWRPVFSAPAYTTPGYSAGDYTQTGGSSWTVDSGDVDTLRYAVNGKQMHVIFYIKTTDVGGTPSSLNIKIPGGYTAAIRAHNVINTLDAGGAWGVGFAEVSSGATVINCYKDAAQTAWAATSGDNTYVIGQITFEVQ